MEKIRLAWADRLGLKDAHQAMQKLIAHKETSIIILLLAVICLGLLITPQYGESWDELKFYKYADSSLQAYGTWLSAGEIPLTGNTYDNYGPAYVMAVTLVSRLLATVLPWIQSDIRHLLYFLTYAAGIWAFYRLGRRWFSRLAAAGATALFATQPLFWGHAFISPKDIPFLSLFLLALHFGLSYFDKDESLSWPRPGKLLLALTIAWLASLLLLFGGTALIHSWLEAMVRAAAAGQDNLLARIASDISHVQPEVYIQKYFVLFLRLRAAFFLLTTSSLVFYYWKYGGLLKQLSRVLLPGILLGLTVCVRVLGPLAGLIVAIHALRKHGRAALPAMLAYTAFAVAAMYATWPYLWPDPIGHFVESLVVMAKYPWPGQVLFNGSMLASTDLPASYLPLLLAIQLTEPVWILFATGLGLVIWDAARRQAQSLELLWITAIWFVLPLLAFILLRSPLYDNFRQVFFILPPVFLLAGAVLDHLPAPGWKTALIVLCVLPGVIFGLRLHPYEYIYYNHFTGGQAGAFRKFEMDYWGTSYREAAAWLNREAPQGSAIWVDGPAHLLGMYLRPDLKTYSTYEQERAEHYDFSVSTSRYDLDLTSYPQAPVVYTISRDAAVLTVIKKP